MSSNDDWEKMLDKRRQLHMHAVTTNDYTFLKEHRAQAQKPSNVSILASDATRTAFNEMLATAAAAQKQDAKDLKDHFEHNENGNTSEEDWEVDIDNSREDMQVKAGEEVHKLFTDAKSYIKTNVPAAERRRAAEVFQTGAEAVEELFSLNADSLQNVWRMAGVFQEKDWEGIEKAVDSIVKAVEEFVGGLS